MIHSTHPSTMTYQPSATIGPVLLNRLDPTVTSSTVFPPNWTSSVGNFSVPRVAFLDWFWSSRYFWAAADFLCASCSWYSRFSASFQPSSGVLSRFTPDTYKTADTDDDILPHAIIDS